MINQYPISCMDDKVDFSDFRMLLESLENAEVMIRLRAMGQAWTSYSKLILLSDSALILEDGEDQRMVLYVKNIIKFQVEKAVHSFKPGTTYEVVY